MLCRGAEVKIRVHWRISVEAPESMQESKLFARRLQELDERFVNTFIRKNEIFYMPFTCSPIWRIIRKLFLSTGCLCYNSSSDTIFLDGRFPLDADWGNWSLLFRCESLQHQNVHVCVVMIPLLGVTWLFGLLSPVHKAFVYIFTILNSAQVSVRW